MAIIHSARLQGLTLAKTALGLKNSRSSPVEILTVESPEKNLKKFQIKLPLLPKAVGNYQLHAISGNLIYINQIALKDGKIDNPGIIGNEVSLEMAKVATRQTMLNILSILNDALDGDLSKFKKCVQLTGYLNTVVGFKDHSLIMNEASQLTIDVFGDSGKHTRAAVGASSLPLNSSVEIQAIFEIRP